MQIKTKLLLPVLLLGFALGVNLIALGFLTRTINVSLKTIEEVSIRQQLIASQMHAQLREAEAALYRYLREGESGYVTQFEDQLQNFELDVTTYQALVSNDEERAWAAELAVAHQDAVEVGQELIHLHDQQTADLQQLEETQAALTELLSGAVRAVRPNDVIYQEAVGGMHTQVREMILAITAYLASPDSTDRVRLTEAAVGFRRHHNQFGALANTTQENAWVQSLSDSFSEVQTLGSRLVSGRDQQDAQFANFAAILFSTGQGILVGEIQPRAAENLALAQEELLAARNFSVVASLITAISVSILAAVVTLPLLRQMSRSILALLQGADRVTAGELTEPVHVGGRDEFSRLAEAFNTMMTELAAREHHLKARLSDLEALRQVSLQLTSTLDMDKVLDTIAFSALNLIGAKEAHIFMCDDTGANPRFAASAWRDEADHRSPRPPRADGLVTTVARGGRVQVVNMAEEHPLFDTPEAQEWGLKAAAGFPLKLGDQLLGVFRISFDDRSTLDEDELRILSLLADQAAVALENARLYKSVAEKEMRLQSLAHKLTYVQEEERRLIGLDLHDGLTQLLLSANMHLSTLASVSSGMANAARNELGQGRARLGEAIDEARRVVSELRPTTLEDFGLVEGLRHYAGAASQAESWQLEFSAELGEVKVAPAVETAIFRIAQEALTNVRKHAHATRIRVTLQVDGSSLNLEVRDWGCGFDLASFSEERECLGLVGMRERAALLGGECQVESHPQQGTRVWVWVPITSAIVDGR